MQKFRHFRRKNFSPKKVTYVSLAPSYSIVQPPLAWALITAAVLGLLLTKNVSVNPSSCLMNAVDHKMLGRPVGHVSPNYVLLAYFKM